ncbi:hypothetical protein [Rhabdothermincola salaria]|uniref:hypothetical protein n=1 Tax=Rhabdothermincola salaria TaxID=2903142 RepID=UPI001E3084CA|nr:hypothetical protein [Rhabdothermincola salaria]MCD9624411.1 hypothetical protein [Rhabdothermincola salaria]
MSSLLTEITELATALGTMAEDLDGALARRPGELRQVPDQTWERVVAARLEGGHDDAFATAFANGRAFLAALDGLRGRPPRLVEWKGPHRPPGDDVVPADLRIDHVYQVSCKYLSRITVNAGPARLFDRLLVGEERSGGDWFATVAPAEYQMLYATVRDHVGAASLPDHVDDLDRAHREVLKRQLRGRAWPDELRAPWAHLCDAVATGSARRWDASLGDRRRRLRMFWRLVRIGDAPYFVLGADGRTHLRLRIGSTWDWVQAFELRSLDTFGRSAGQPEVGWRAVVRDRQADVDRVVEGHVEVRWSHGRFQGSPEAKVYLDTPHVEVPGHHPLV